MAQGLSIQRLINVELVLTPLPVQALNFDTCLVIGDSNIINVTDRIRTYNDLESVALDFGTTAPEYQAATVFFSQIPQPPTLYIGRWAQTATAALLVCGPLNGTQQAIANWTAVTAGSFKIAVDGGPATNVAALNFSAVSNLNGVATIIQTAMRALAGAYTNTTCVWNGEQFIFGSGTTGTSSTISALTTGTTGTDISVQLAGTAATLEEIVPGIAAETALAAVTILDNLNQPQWYAFTVASTHIVDSDHLAIAAFIEAGSPQQPHLYGITTSEAAALTTGDNSSIGYQLSQLKYRRTAVQYSSTMPYAITSIFGRGCTINFNENNSTITFMWKQEPGVVAENLTATEAGALDANHYNYFANYNNGTAIITNGMVANGDFIDNTWDLDWLVNQIQNNVWNLMFTVPTKVPQTDAGGNMIRNVIEAACVAGVNNGIIAPGIWNQPGFGQLQQGDLLAKGYYVYQPPISSQSESDRAARKSVPFQVAVKLAGAVHTVSITVNVNR